MAWSRCGRCGCCGTAPLAWRLAIRAPAPWLAWRHAGQGAASEPGRLPLAHRHLPGGTTALLSLRLRTPSSASGQLQQGAWRESVRGRGADDAPVHKAGAAAPRAALAVLSSRTAWQCGLTCHCMAVPTALGRASKRAGPVQGHQHKAKLHSYTPATHRLHTSYTPATQLYSYMPATPHCPGSLA